MAMPETDSSVPKLFGTDGVRGTAGQYPLDHATVRRIGAALVRALPPSARPPRILIGRDTRESGPWIEGDLAESASGEGASVVRVGVVPTPAVAYLTQLNGFDLGVVVSASHNPFEDNGIKVFSGSGEKFTEEVERVVESIVADASWRPTHGGGGESAGPSLVDAYTAHLRDVFPEIGLLEGTRLVIDCANGATTPIAGQLFQTLGLDATVIGNAPDGRNINLGCGSTHPERLSETVVRTGARMGVAFDGDGDRAIFVDELGRVVNGDAVMLMCSRQLRQEGRLRGNAVVATVMSNVGLELALAELGIALVRCPVGDRYVMNEMLARRLSLGGEQSGHIIFSDHLFTGDGLCTALNVLRTVALSRRSLAELATDLVSYPQVLLNVRVREKVDTERLPAVDAVINQVRSRVVGQGRLLVRYSGTEPLLRVMIEGKDEGEIRAWAQEIADVVQREIGVR
ncbi:MAG: phosphoglucosamine mutase [Acidobacteria bacterium]|nr:MAG: phosphoglucosamine mutase [Acidobacteriota bacterium]